ncbi:YeeE/YedE family protein [Myxococcota bacterium]|nr:YeeE/YedE family protein [Myxococcota bacterium]MBU1429078.1 YeeE/YedE family protein [Myxococcota bacterium]MBU1899866.1 YeeE/YedE family protein [Myxococcota bacterium]
MERSFWNPYVAGIFLGLVLLASYLLLGHGLGASGAAYRVGVAGLNTLASGHVAANPQMASTVAGGALDHWILLMALGAGLGGLFSAYTSGRFKVQIIRGPHATIATRLIFALSGGMIMGAAARLTRGCTSGQALSGGALMSLHSWIFMLAVFAGGYALAWFIRRQWI